MRVPDEVRKCIVFVGLPVAVLPNGGERISFIGTAFFVVVQSTVRGGYGYLVTAKHVAEKLTNTRFYIRINRQDGQADTLEGKGIKWVTHPTDESVDVAVLPWTPSREEFDYKAVFVDTFLSDEIITKEGIGIGDEVFIMGLFAHATGSRKNEPIVRMGNIAMMPSEVIPTEWDNIEAYLVEARSIGGLSGSPAFVRKTVPVGIGRFYLLGMMHGHWDIPTRNINDIIAANDQHAKVNMGIAIVIPARVILEVLNHPDLVKIREQKDKELLSESS
jgi:hypothetical protein